MAAGEPFYSPVNLNMLVKVCSLSETKVAIGERTSVGSFVGMDPEVIEEVVPFPEMFSAFIMVTLQDLNVSFRFGVLEGEDSEFLSTWYMFLDLHGSQIESFTGLYENGDVVRDVIKGIALFLDLCYSHLVFTFLSRN
jgi:hypothetical protein